MRGTVISFYETYGLESTASFSLDSTELPNVDLVCPLDDEEIDLRIRNDDLTRQCSSRQLQVLHDGLKIARMVVHVIVETNYIMLQLMFTFARLLIPGAYCIPLSRITIKVVNILTRFPQGWVTRAR